MTSETTRALGEITIRTDTRDILAHASRQAKKHRFDEMLIVDVDAHITETAFWGEIVDRIDSDVYRHMAAAFRERSGSPPGLLNAVPGMAYQDVFGRIPHQQSQAEAVEDSDVHRQVTLTRRAIDAMSIDYMVVFPTPMLLLGTHPQTEVEVELAWAFNRWLTEEVLPQEPRMKGLMYLPFNTPEACPRFVEEFGDKPGTMGFTVTSTRNRPVHHNAYMPLYAALEERNLPLAFHAGFNWNDGSMAQLNRFLSMHALSFVHCNLIHMTNWVVNGLPVRFPGLKVLWIESGIAWLPYLMQRLDSELHDAFLRGAAADQTAERVHQGDVFLQPAAGIAASQADGGDLRGDRRGVAASLVLRLAALGLRFAVGDLGSAVPPTSARSAGSWARTRPSCSASRTPISPARPRSRRGGQALSLRPRKSSTRETKASGRSACTQCPAPETRNEFRVREIARDGRRMIGADIVRRAARDHQRRPARRSPRAAGPGTPTTPPGPMRSPPG